MPENLISREWPAHQQPAQRACRGLNKQLPEKLIGRHRARLGQPSMTYLPGQHDGRQREIEKAVLIPLPVPSADMPAAQTVERDAPQHREDTERQAVDDTEQ